MKIAGSANTAMVRRMREHLQRSAAAQRTGSRRMAIAAGAVCAVAEDGAAARALVHREPAPDPDVVEGLRLLRRRTVPASRE